MELAEILDLILDGTPVVLECIMPANKESTRIVLLEKFKRHCRWLDSVGYLPEELEGKTLGFSYDKVKQELTLSIKAKRERIQYKVLGHED